MTQLLTLLLPTCLLKFAVFNFHDQLPHAHRKDLAACQRQHKQEMTKYNKLMREKTKYDSEVKSAKASCDSYTQNLGWFLNNLVYILHFMCQCSVQMLHFNLLIRNFRVVRGGLQRIDRTYSVN